jgi:hypothetical protein
MKLNENKESNIQREKEVVVKRQNCSLANFTFTLKDDSYKRKSETKTE